MIGVWLGRRAEAPRRSRGCWPTRAAQTTLPELRPGLTLLEPPVAAAGLDVRARRARLLRAAGRGGRGGLRDHLGARVAAAGVGGGGDRGARRVRFYVDQTSPLSPIQLVRTPGFGGDVPGEAVTRAGRPARLARRHGGAARGGRGARGVAASEPARVGRRGCRRAAAGVADVCRHRARLGARRPLAPRARRSTEHRPRAIVYSSTTAALLAPGRARSASTPRPPATARAATGCGSARSSAAAARRAAARAVERGRAGRGARARTRTRWSCPSRSSPPGPRGRARHRRDHLRRKPGEEGPRPRARRMGGGAARGRRARRGGPR